MATRRKIVADPWKQSPHAAELINGVPVVQWENQNTGEVRMMRNGLHPDDQPNADAYGVALADDDGEDFEETATDRVITMLQSANDGGRAELKVYRVNQGVMEYCKSYQPDEFENGNFELLREKFGAGTYELRLYATNPTTNKFVVRSKSRIQIAEDMKPAAGGDMSSGMAQILATIAQGQQQMLEALVSIKQTPQKDPMDEMSKMFGMMSMMREAMGISNAPATREKSSIGEIVSAIRELRGAADELIPEKEKEPDGLMSMLPSVLELVKNGQQAAPAMSAPQFAPMTLPPSIAQATPPVQAQQPQQPQQPQQQPPEGEDVNFMIVLKLKGYLASLVDMAKKSAPISEGAQFVYDNLPDDLIEIMALPNWFDMLSGFNKALLTHKDWLTSVRDEALKMFDEPEGGDDVGKAT